VGARDIVSADRTLSLQAQRREGSIEIRATEQEL
jgi:hypothetical protein